ncbi:MAG: hypothetical protein AB1592_18865 [Pseudomonadota bacterium]
MAHAETLGWCECDRCGGQVAAKVNRAGLAYYRCDHCGVEVRHHWHRTSDEFTRQFAEKNGDSAHAGGGAGSGEKPPAKPAEKPAAPQKKAWFDLDLGAR